MVDCKYVNELPKPPVPKLLKAIPSIDRLCRYRPTSLELDHRPLLLSEKGLLACVELVDPDAYGALPAEGSMPPPPPPQDAQLLRDDDITEEEKEAAKKREILFEQTEAFHREAFGLQLPQLITNDVFTERQRFTTGTSAAEKKLYRDPPGFGSMDSLAEKIEATFQDAREAPVHPTKPSLKVKRVMPVVPDAVLWANRYQQVIFDELCISDGTPFEAQTNDLLFKTVPTPRMTCFGYFSQSSEDTGTYKLAQNYIWNNRGHATRASNCGEGEAVLLNFPTEEEPNGECRFLHAPTYLTLKKQKAHRLDLDLETKSLSVKVREPEADEEDAELRERMNVVLVDDSQEEFEASSIYFEDGEWKMPRISQAGGSSNAGGSSHAAPRVSGEGSSPAPAASSTGDSDRESAQESRDGK